MLIFRGMGEEYDPDAPLPLGYDTTPPPTKGGAIVDEKRRTMTFTEPEVITAELPKKKKPVGGFPTWALWGGGAAVLTVAAYANKAKLLRIFG